MACVVRTQIERMTRVSTTELSALYHVHHNHPAGPLSHSGWRVKSALGTRYQTVLNCGLRLPVRASTVSMTAIGQQAQADNGE